ncbi:hypothetical protein EOT10_37050 [Streptomyces antnestii]|uniref:Uncharacterized protein n=1 Tax=Streptomyces antnestii TaxID=2494256 RepID=A0A3S2YQ13_9ACTN|nr:hypothetical protein EOT10_37050 [Streptomyces sp. San01]
MIRLPDRHRAFATRCAKLAVGYEATSLVAVLNECGPGVRAARWSSGAGWAGTRRGAPDVGGAHQADQLVQVVVIDIGGAVPVAAPVDDEQPMTVRSMVTSNPLPRRA